MTDHSSTHRHTNTLNYNNYLVSLRVKNILLSTPLKTNSYIKHILPAKTDSAVGHFHDTNSWLSGMASTLTYNLLSQLDHLYLWGY